MKKLLPLLVCLLLAACTVPTPLPDLPDDAPSLPGPLTATPTPFQPLLTSPTLEIPAPTGSGESQTPEPTTPSTTALTIWLHPSLSATLPPNLQVTGNPETADLRLVPGGDGPVYAVRVYALAAPFPTLVDGISAAKLHDLWTANKPGLLASPETADAIERSWGASGNGLQILPANELLDTAWENDLWAIIPFETLSPEWKVLSVAGESPMHKGFDPEDYPLTFPFTLQGEAGLVDAVTALYGPGTPQPLLAYTNRDPTKFTTLVMTGVTALVRATAFLMEQNGVLYPARDIGDWLRQADILHISNEVPFAENCPFPNPVQQGVVFWSDPDYLQLLEDIGTDVVELTGDHFHDWGQAAMHYTLDLYKAEGWPVYGGGATFDEGKQPALLEHNGNRIAFIGCNGKGGGFAQASATTAGSVHCDFDWLHRETERLTEAGYLVIATFQHFEYYSYAPPATMWADFRGMAEAGAVVVSGSQAHHPHGFEFWEGGFIHYGLGNLFFDQLGISPGTGQAFIDRHVFYDGHYLGVELLTIQFEDLARARPMTESEREALLRIVYSASDW